MCIWIEHFALSLIMSVTLLSEPDGDGDVILRAGFVLHKPGRRPSLSSGWKPRYTVLLSTGTLLCFKNPDDLSPCQVLHLVPGMSVERGGNLQRTHSGNPTHDGSSPNFNTSAPTEVRSQDCFLILLVSHTPTYYVLFSRENLTMSRRVEIPRRPFLL
jgi:hypothetical protein